MGAAMHGRLVGRSVQVWRLSDLTLLHTILLPPGPRGDEQLHPAEPRLLADGKTVMVGTFRCGLHVTWKGAPDAPAVAQALQAGRNRGS